jgi:putative endonuclease
MTQWTVYILKCNDNSYYTGITNNLKKRLDDHTNGKGAKYMRGRTPFDLVFSESHPDRSSALKRENEIKKLTKTEKEILITQGR